MIDNPLVDGASDPIVAIPAIAPDVALFHCPMADDAGNVWIGRERDLVTMAHAATTTLVTVERRYEGNLYDDPALAAGTLSSFYVTAVAEAAEGANPQVSPVITAKTPKTCAPMRKRRATMRVSPPISIKPCGTPRSRDGNQKRRAADRGNGAFATGHAAHCGGRVIADPGVGRAADPTVVGRHDLVSILGDPSNTFWSDGGKELFRLRGPGTDRCVLFLGRADRRIGQHQPRGDRRLSAIQGTVSAAPTAPRFCTT